MNYSWYKFTEHNDNEGETWHFFVQLSSEEFEHIQDILILDDYLAETYTLSFRQYDLGTIETLIAESDEGYYKTYNMCPRPYRTDILSIEGEEADEEFYKGGLWLLCAD